MIPVERAQIGMILVEGVSDLRGRLLIPAGKELTERYLECLPMWGVTHVEVEGEDDEEEEVGLDDLEPWALERAEERVSEHFRLSNPDHPFLAALHPICVGRRAVEIQREGES
jgi:hypothetical protein